MGPAGPRCSRPGRRFRSSGSAPTCRPWVAASACCGRWEGVPGYRRRPANRRRADQGSAPAPRAVADGGPAGGGGQRGPDRRGRTGRPAGGHGLPTRVDRRAPRRAGRTGRHRRRLPVHVGRAGPDRPLGRRGGPADPVRRLRPAIDRRPGTDRAVRMPRAGGGRDDAEAGVGSGGLRPVGPPPVGPSGRRRPVRRHGVVAAVAGRLRGAGHRPAGR